MDGKGAELLGHTFGSLIKHISAPKKIPLNLIFSYFVEGLIVRKGTVRPSVRVPGHGVSVSTLARWKQTHRVERGLSSARPLLFLL